jgi:hypothetical protein
MRSDAAASTPHARIPPRDSLRQHPAPCSRTQHPATSTAVICFICQRAGLVCVDTPSPHIGPATRGPRVRSSKTSASSSQVANSRPHPAQLAQEQPDRYRAPPGQCVQSGAQVQIGREATASATGSSRGTSRSRTSWAGPASRSAPTSPSAATRCWSTARSASAGRPGSPIRLHPPRRQRQAPTAERGGPAPAGPPLPPRWPRAIRAVRAWLAP